MRVLLAVLTTALGTTFIGAAPPIGVSPPPMIRIVTRPAPPVPPAPLAPPAAPIVRRKIVSSPNFGDYNIYPAEARERDETGRVDFELLIDRAGVPLSCRLIAESLSPSLNAATCEKALLIRFEPLDRTTAFRSAINWRLSDPLAIGSSSIRMVFDNPRGGGAPCKIGGAGPVADHFEEMACKGREHFLAIAKESAARRPVELTVALDAGDGEVPMPSNGRVLALSRMSFTVNSNGDAADCTMIEQRGAALANPLYTSPCGQFLGSVYFEAPEPGSPPVRGTLEVRLVERKR